MLAVRCGRCAVWRLQTRLCGRLAVGAKQRSGLFSRAIAHSDPGADDFGTKIEAEEVRHADDGDESQGDGQADPESVQLRSQGNSARHMGGDGTISGPQVGPLKRSKRAMLAVPRRNNLPAMHQRP